MDAVYSNCETICSGKLYWLRSVLVPRKCTQSEVQVCSRSKISKDYILSEEKNESDNKVIRKRFHSKKAYLQEKRILKHCGKLPVDYSDVFPRLLDYDDQDQELWLSYCGEPIIRSDYGSNSIVPETLVRSNLHENDNFFAAPDNCYQQVEQFADALSALRIVHNDLVPHNVLQDPTTGKLRLLDFGRAIRVKFKDDLAGREKLALQKQKIKEFAKLICDPDKLKCYIDSQLKLQNQS